MPRNKSEKMPIVVMSRMVTPAACAPMLLKIRKAQGVYSVWVGCGADYSYRFKASDGMEAQQVYNWFEDGFYYSRIPSWHDGRWDEVHDAA